MIVNITPLYCVPYCTYFMHLLLIILYIMLNTDPVY